MTKRQAIAEVRAEANALIEQLSRRARGMDQGPWRDDCRIVDRQPHNRISATIRAGVEHAFNLSRQYA